MSKRRIKKSKVHPFDLANRQQVYLERLKAGYIFDWKTTQTNLRNRVKAVLSALEVDTMKQIEKRALLKVLAGLRMAQVEVTAPAMDNFLGNLPDLAAYSARLEGTKLSDVTQTRFNIPTAADAYKFALNAPVQATGELMQTMIQDWPVRDALRISNLVQKGWAQNLTLSDMIRQACGTKANNYADGFLDISRQHAGTVINTAIQHTANAARMKVWEDNNDIVKAYRWVSTLDNRTTQQCRSLDGRVFEPGKGPMPPLHPNCRSTTVADLGGEWAFLDEGATRASSGPNAGYVDANITYYDWLKNQPADFQDVAIGPKRGQLFRDGGLSADEFAKLNLGRNFEPLTLAEMRDIEPAAFEKAGL